MGISNREWLYSLDVADLADWFDAEHVDDDSKPTFDVPLCGWHEGEDEHASMTDRDPLEIMRSLRGSIDMPMIKETLCRETGTDNLIDALESLADMVERDYVSRHDFAAQHRTLCAVREQRDELEKQLDTMRDVAREFRDERDGWKAKAEAKSAKRAAAVERLKNSEYHTALDDVCAMLGWGHEPHFEGATDALIDLLTDDDANDDSAHENDVSADDVDANDANATQDTREKLEAKVTDLQIQLEAMSDVANDYRFERDELREKVDTLTRYIHDIKQIARKV